jgi:hypothetical protein
MRESTVLGLESSGESTHFPVLTHAKIADAVVYKAHNACSSYWMKQIGHVEPTTLREGLRALLHMRR